MKSSSAAILFVAFAAYAGIKPAHGFDHGPVKSEYYFCGGIASDGPLRKAVARLNSHEFAMGVCYEKWDVVETHDKKITIFQCNADTRQCKDVVEWVAIKETKRNKEPYTQKAREQDLLFKEEKSKKRYLTKDIRIAGWHGDDVYMLQNRRMISETEDEIVIDFHTPSWPGFDYVKIDKDRSLPLYKHFNDYDDASKSLENFFEDENPNGMKCEKPAPYLDARDDKGIIKLFVDRCGHYTDKGDIELHIDKATGLFEWK